MKKQIIVTIALVSLISVSQAQVIYKESDNIYCRFLKMISLSADGCVSKLQVTSPSKVGQATSTNVTVKTQAKSAETVKDVAALEENNLEYTDIKKSLTFLQNSLSQISAREKEIVYVKGEKGERGEKGEAGSSSSQPNFFLPVIGYNAAPTNNVSSASIVSEVMSTFGSTLTTNQINLNGPLNVSGSAGATGTVLTSNGPGLAPSWTIVSGGGAASTSPTFFSSTSTNLFAANATITSATTTNLFTNILTALTSSFTNLFATNATTTNSTSTNLFATNSNLTNVNISNTVSFGGQQGTTGQVLTSSGTGTAPRWSTISGASTSPTFDSSTSTNNFFTNNARINNLLTSGAGYVQALFKTSGTGDRTSAIQIENNNVSPQRWEMAVGGTGNGAGMPNGQFYIYDITQATNRLTIDTSGNVGIGTTSPATRLDVNGGINITNNFLSNYQAGSLGQVLTSNGTGTAPRWSTVSGGGSYQYYAEAANAPSSTPTATGLSSVAIGNFSTSTGIYSATLGAFNLASGTNAVAIGYSNRSMSTDAYTLGRGNVITSTNSLAVGYLNTAANGNTSAVGYLNTASGASASAFGFFTSASGASAASFGTTNSSQGSQASTFGIFNNASAANSSAFGFANFARSASSSAFGYRNLITTGAQDSSAFGASSTVSATNSLAIGNFIMNNTPNTVQIGTSDTAKIIIDAQGGIVATYATATNATSTNLFSNMISAVTSSFTGLFATNATTTNLNINNLLSLNGQYGTAGQVLTSGGAGVAPTWATVSGGGGGGSSTTTTFDNATATSNFFAGVLNIGSALRLNGQEGSANQILTANGTGTLASYRSLFGTSTSLLKYYAENGATPSSSPTATGFSSIAIGNFSTSTGVYSATYGYNNLATGDRSTSVGSNNRSEASLSAAFGISNVANGSGFTSAAFGAGNISGASASAFGNSNTASGQQASAFGYINTASALKASSIGYLNMSLSASSTAFGYRNTINLGAESSSAFGAGSVVSATNSLAIGNYIVNNVANSVQIGTSDANKIVIDGNGRLGVGTTSPSQTLSVGGTAYITSALGVGRVASGFTFDTQGTARMQGLTALVGASGALCYDLGTSEIKTSTAVSCSVSSARFKHNIVDLDTGLESVLKLKPKSFEYNNASGTERIGFIAEEVKEVESRLVFYDEDGVTVRGVRYDEVVSLLTRAIQDFYKEFVAFKDALTEKITTKKVETKELCVDDVCINSTQLRQILENNNANSQTSTQSTPSQPEEEEPLENSPETGSDTGEPAQDEPVEPPVAPEEPPSIAPENTENSTPVEPEPVVISEPAEPTEN